MNIQSRQCGACNVCCVAPSIGQEDVEPPLSKAKPAGEACEHCNPSGSCNVYMSRPPLCKDYLCLYTMGLDDVWPMDSGVCWTFQPVPMMANKFLLIGHCQSIKDAEKNEDVMNKVKEWLAGRRSLGIPGFDLYAVTFRSPNRVKSFQIHFPDDDDGKPVSTHEAPVDQSDPIKQAILGDQEKFNPCEFRIR